MNINHLHEAAQSLSKYTKMQELTGYSQDLLSLMERVREEELIIPVLGQFKRGKSTFINYVIGKELLPTGAIPVTSIVTRLKYNKKEAAEIIFEDGHTEAIEINNLHLYISEQHNPKNEKKIHEVVVYYPSDFLKQGVTIVDTPGVGSIHKHNTDTAYEFLSHADAAIFMISADTPINEIEISFLCHIKMSVNKLYFVLNKTDLLKKEEQNTYVSFCKNILEGTLEKKGINIYPISLKLAVEAQKNNDTEKYKESGVDLLFSDLKNKIIQDKSFVLSNSYKDKLTKIAESMLSTLDLKINMLNMPIEKLEAAAQKFETRIKEIKIIQDEAIMLLDGKCEQIIKNIESHINIEKDAMIDKIKEKVIDTYKSNQGHKPKSMYNILLDSLKKEIEDVFDEWRKKEDKHVEEHYENIIRDFSLQLESIAFCINDIVKEIFQTEYKADFTFSGVKDMDNLFYKISTSSTLIAVKPIDIIKLLPFKAINKIMLNHVLDMVKDEVRRNGGRVKSDYLYKINESKIVFKAQFQSIIKKLTSDIENMILHAMEQKKNMDDDIKSLLLKTQNMHDEIKHIFDNYLQSL